MFFFLPQPPIFQLFESIDGFENCKSIFGTRWEDVTHIAINIESMNKISFISMFAAGFLAAIHQKLTLFSVVLRNHVLTDNPPFVCLTFRQKSVLFSECQHWKHFNEKKRRKSVCCQRTDHLREIYCKTITGTARAPLSLIIFTHEKNEAGIKKRNF